MSEFAKSVLAQARKELEAEQFRKAVAEQKNRLLQKRSLWDRLFPWTISIRRK